jgi:hypothetical protein
MAKGVGDLFIPFKWIGGTKKYSEVKADATEFLIAVQRVALAVGIYFTCHKGYDYIFFVSKTKAFNLKNAASLVNVASVFLPEIKLGVCAFVFKHALDKLIAFTLRRMQGREASLNWAAYGIIEMLMVIGWLGLYEGYVKTGKWFYPIGKETKKEDTYMYKIGSVGAMGIAYVVTGQVEITSTQ